MKFPTGGTAREPKGMIRCDSGADSKVWMGEDEQDDRTIRINGYHYNLHMSSEVEFPFQSFFYFIGKFDFCRTLE